MKKLVTVLLALAMAFTMVFATAASAEDGYKDSITWVIGNDQDILDPQNNVSNSKVIPQYYDGLLGYDNDGNVVCKMAESYEASEDKMTWTFHLRQDVYFHSGRHCTAHDFEATFDRLLNTENPQRYTSNASFIDTAVATDDYTFVITLKEPKAFFLQAIAKQWAFVLNPEYIEKYGADLGKTAESVDGTGPFKCTQWDKGEVMKFEAFENYYEGAPLTHEIVMKIVPEQTSRAIAVETAQADIADGVSPDDAVRLDALDGVTVSKTDGNGCHLFQFNCASTHAPMSIPAVRQAICYAIDRNAICEYLYSGLGETPIDSIMAPSVAGYSSVGVVPYDPEKAKQLLAEAGYPDGFDLTIMTSAMYNRAVEMAEIIAEELKEIGINAKLEVVERAVFTSAWANFTPEEFNEKFGWDMFIMGSGGDSDADTLLKRIMRGISNCYENSKPVIESLEKELKPELNHRMRPELYGDAVNEIILNCSFSFYDHYHCKTNYIIADESLKLKQKDFYPALLNMFTEKEIEDNGYYLRNRFSYGPFKPGTGRIRAGIVFEKAFSELPRQKQKQLLCTYFIHAVQQITSRLGKKVNYNFSLMTDDFKSILEEWCKKQI